MSGNIKTVDIVIPTRNEEERLAICLDALIAARKRLREESTEAPQIAFIVADAGSSDETVVVAAQRDAMVIEGLPMSRGDQLAHGVAAGEGDIVLMLHADCRIHVDGLCQLVEAFASRPALQWGILGGRFDRRTFKMKFLEFLNRWRFLLAGIAFGDQGMFSRRAYLAARGGVPDIPLMEDVELSLRLRGGGRRLHLGPLLEVSARRWDSNPFFRSSGRVIRICLDYVVRRRLGGNIHAIAARMYREYYGRDPTTPGT